MSDETTPAPVEELDQEAAEIAARLTAGNAKAPPAVTDQPTVITMKTGPSLTSELDAAGLLDRPVFITADRVQIAHDVSDADLKAIKAVLTAHDPTKPAPPTFVDEISDRQFFQQLAIEGDITEDDALAAVQTGVIPTKLAAILAGLPASQQFNAKMLLAGATTFKFSNPITAALAAALTPPRTTEQMKALWVAAAQLV